MNDGMSRSIFKEWARRFAPGLIETQTAFPLDSDLGIPPKLAPIEGVFTGEKRNLSLGGPPPERMGYRGPGITPQTSSPATQETTSVPVALTQENPLADYTPQPPVKTTPVEGEKKSGEISPGAMGLLGMGLSMAATPPRAVPYSGAEIIGRSGLAGLGIYEKALEDKRRQQALDVSAEEHRLSREDRRQHYIEWAQNAKETRANEATRIAESNLWKKEQEAYKREQTDKLKRAEEHAQEEVSIDVLEGRGQDHLVGISREDYIAFGLNKDGKAATKKAADFQVVKIDGEKVTIDKNNLTEAQQKALDEGRLDATPEPKPAAKPTALSERMALAEQALQDEHSRNNLVPSHGRNTAPPPMTKKFTTSEIAAKAEDMFGKKTAPGKLSFAGAGALARKGAAPGTVGKTRPVKMPDGSIWYFDAAGNRVR